MARSVSTSDEDKYRAPALSKGIDILELLAGTVEGLTLGEISRMLGRTNSEIFRMIVVLRARGYVVLGDDDRYFLTTKMFEVAHRHPPIQRLTAIAGGAMQKLANRVNQSIHLSILHSGKLLVVAQVDCQDNFLASVRLGAQIPIYDSASGRAIAAFLEQGALSHLLALAGEEPAEARTRFLADLTSVRTAGYFQQNSRTIEGIVDLSAPVFDYTGRVIAAVTTPYIRRISSPSAMPVTEARDALVATCRDLSSRMGAGGSGQI